jgi:hypothetical protein
MILNLCDLQSLNDLDFKEKTKLKFVLQKKSRTMRMMM